jgi:hypothetical protein
VSGHSIKTCESQLLIVSFFSWGKQEESSGKKDDQGTTGFYGEDINSHKRHDEIALMVSRSVGARLSA